MGRSTKIQTNVTAGEISPLCLGLVDQSRYHNSGEIVENWLVRSQGPLTKRPGLQFIVEVKDSSKQVKLIRFEFNVTQAYMLEFGDKYVRFCKDKGQIYDGASPYEIISPYEEADLRGIKFIQSADMMYLVHPSYWVRTLSRADHTDWTLDELDLGDGPYLEENTGAITITPSGTTGSITLTASADLFDAGHVGAYWRLQHGGTWGYVQITGFTDAQHVTATVKTTLGATLAVTAWREGAFSDYRGFPKALAFCEERLLLGGTAHKPWTFWGSKSHDWTNFAPQDTITDDGPITFTVPSQTGSVNVIQWICGARSLLIGTAGEEISMTGSGSGDPLTPSNPPVIRGNTAKGSANLMPVPLGNTVLFMQRHGRILRELSYSFADDDYVCPNLTIWSEHITRGGVVEMAFQREPDQVLWAVRTDGQLLAMVYERDQKVVGWGRMVTDGEIESVSEIPGTQQTEVWVVVKRTIDGGIKRYLECFGDLDWGDDQADCFFVDSGLTYDGAPTDTISGLDHLEGKIVAVLADGAVHPSRTVSGGEISLDYEASVVQVGLPYTAKFKSVPLEAGQEEGTAQGKDKTVDQVVLRLLNSLGGKVGPDEDNLEELVYRDVIDPMDTAIPLYTGDLRVDYPGWTEPRGQIYLEHEYPVPMTICAIIPRVTTYEG